MSLPRVIPALLLKGNGLVKGVKFKNHEYVGDPINTVKIFNDKEVDELIILDIMASLNANEPNFEILKELASEAFMPMGYGGGIQSFDHAKRVFDLGFEKIVIGTAALINLDLIASIANVYGSQSVVISMDIKKNWFKKYQLYGYSGSKKMNTELKKFVDQIISAGAGEILLNNIDHDGTKKGYDLDIIKEISDLASVPIVSLGGAWELNDLKKGIQAGASAVSAGAMFVYEGKFNAVMVNYPKYSEIEHFFEVNK